MIKEKFYRKLIRPEHWDEFVDLCGPEDYSSCMAEADYFAHQVEAAFMISSVLYPECYTNVSTD